MFNSSADEIAFIDNGDAVPLHPHQPAITRPPQEDQTSIVILRNTSALHLAHVVIAEHEGEAPVELVLAAAGEAGDAKTVLVQGGATLKILNITDVAGVDVLVQMVSVDEIAIVSDGDAVTLQPRQQAVSRPLPDDEDHVVTVQNLNAAQMARFHVERGGKVIEEGSLPVLGEVGNAKTVLVQGGATVKVTNVTDSRAEEVELLVRVASVDEIEIIANGSAVTLRPHQQGIMRSLPDGKINQVTVKNMNASYEASYRILHGKSVIDQASLAMSADKASAKTVPVRGGVTLKVINDTINDMERVDIQVQARFY